MAFCPMPSSPHTPFHVGAVLAASNGSPGSSPVAGRFPNFVAAEIYGDLQPPPPLSLSARSNADPSNRTKGRSTAAVMATAAAVSSRHSHTASYVASGIAVAGPFDEHSFGKPAAAALNEEQRRCVNSAYNISFHGDPRVKLKPTAVELPNGVHFLIVDRFVSGNCDGVYEKNKKMWEHIPVGQARVFARAPPAAQSLSLDELVEETVTLPCPGRLGSPVNAAVGSPPSLPPIAPPSTASVLGSISPPNQWESSQPQQHSFHNEWTRVATAVGLRKMGHWREATSVFSIHKEMSKTAIALAKVDGEPGHIAAFSWLGERYWMIGCRYQHIVTRLNVPEVDLVRYATSNSSLVSTLSSTPTVSDDASVSATLSSAERQSASTRAESPTQNPLDGVEQSSVHGSTVAGGAAGKCIGGTSSEAAYLDLAVRMARLWRRVLESLLTTTDDAAEALDPASSNDIAAPARTDALVELHACVAADNRSLCFDVIISGWERLHHFRGIRGYSVDKSLSRISMPGTGPSNDTTRTNRSNSTAFMVGSGPVTGDSGAVSTTSAAMTVAVPLWFYAVTWDASLDERGWCMGVEEAFAFFGHFQLPTVPKSADVQLGSPEYEGLRHSVLSRCDTAGAVMYGSSKDKAEGGKGAVVVQVWKCRAYPHSLERTVQEYVVTHRLCGEPLRCKVKKKVSSLSRETRLCIKQWELHRLPFLLDFALWLHREKYITPSTDLVALKAIRGQWLSYQERFEKILETQQQQRPQAFSRQGSTVSASEAVHSRLETCADAVDGMCCSASSADKDGQAEHSDGSLQQQSEQDDTPLHDAERLDPIMLVGPQGCGKSTMARILYALLEESGAAPRWLNQDEVGNRSAYLAAVRRAVTQGSYSHLLLDKMNLDEKSRSDYAAAGLKPALVVVWTHNEGVEAMVEVCCERVVKRGVHHRTFCPEDVASLRPPPSFVPSGALKLRPAAVPLPQGVLYHSDSPETSPTPSSTVSLSPVSLSQCGCSPNVPFPPERSSPPPPTRLHGILHANVKRYQVPTNAPLVELDVTWSCRKMAAVVWEALRDKGACMLPPLAELNVEAAIQTAYAYEQLLETYPSRVASAVLRGPSSEVVLQQLSLLLPPLIIPKTQRLQSTVEVLLHNFCQDRSPTALVRYAGQVGKRRRMTVQAVVSNSKVALLLMLGPTEAAAAHSAASLAAVEHGEETVVPAHSGAAPPALYPAPSLKNTSGKAISIGRGASGGCVASSADPSCLEMNPMQEHFAVLAKAKVTPEYCETLVQRVRNDPEEDPYCKVQWLSPPLEIDFAVTLLLP